MNKVKIKLVDGNSKLPEKQTEHASGFDAYVRDYEIEFDAVLYKLGFSSEIPNHMEGIIAARSSLSKTDWYIPNGFGLVDSDYRGEWMLRLKTNDPFNFIPYKQGERCCQILFREKLDVSLEVVDELSDTERGNGGFGSTNK